MQRCTEGYKGAQIYVEVHRGVHGSARRGAWKCKEVDRGVCGGGQRVYRGMQKTVKRYTEVCKGAEGYRGM